MDSLMKNNAIKRDIHGKVININNKHKNTTQNFFSDDERTIKSSYLKFADTVTDWNQETIGSLDRNHPFMNNLRKNQFYASNPKSPQP